MAEKNEGSKLSSTWRPANDYVNLKVGKFHDFEEKNVFRKIVIIDILLQVSFLVSDESLQV